jgi:hypothetical protein
MSNEFRNLPPPGFHYANLSVAQQQKMVQFDNGAKGWLTVDELYGAYAAQPENQNHDPDSIAQAVAFFGGPQQVVRSEHVSSWQALGMAYVAEHWVGDFHLSDLGAGNVRQGRQFGQVWNPIANKEVPVDSFMILADCNLVDEALAQRIVAASVVIGPGDFPLEPGSRLAQAVDVPLSLTTADAFNEYERGDGMIQVPDRKFLVAALDTQDMRALMGNSDHLSYYFQLLLDDGRVMYINPKADGGKESVPGLNFKVTADEIKPQQQ